MFSDSYSLFPESFRIKKYGSRKWHIDHLLVLVKVPEVAILGEIFSFFY